MSEEQQEEVQTEPEQQAEENASLSDENVVDYILNKHVAPQEEEPADTADELIDDDSEYESLDEDQEQEEEPTYKVTLPSREVVDVPVSELTRGYSREADYTRKTEALSAERKAVAETLEKANEIREKVTSQLDVFITDGERQLKEAEGLDMLRLHDEDPDQAQKLRLMIDAKRVEVNKAKAAKTDHDVQAKAEYDKNYQEYLKANQTVLIKKIPELKDPKKAKKVFERVNNALLNRGFSPEEISRITDDARVVDAFNDLSHWDEAQAKRHENVKKVSKLPKYQKSGSPRGKGALDKVNYDKALNVAKQEGGSKTSVEDLIMLKLKANQT